MERPFPHPMHGVFQTPFSTLLRFYNAEGYMPRTKKENEICTLEAVIRDRIDWWCMVDDDETISKWFEESEIEDPKALEYAIGECRWQAQAYEGPARPAAVDYTYSIDGLPEKLIAQLVAGCELVRRERNKLLQADTSCDSSSAEESSLDERSSEESNVDESEEASDSNISIDSLDFDYQKSHRFVVKLLDPLMYPYKLGVTPVLGGAERIEAPPWNPLLWCNEAKPNQDSDFYQGLRTIALPSEIQLFSDGSCRINSYINGLHPKVHGLFYGALSALISKVTSLFEAVLAEAKLADAKLAESGKSSPFRYMLEPYERPFRVSHGGACVCGGYGHNPEDGPKIVPKFEPPPLPEFYTLRERLLQLFFGIRSIELTPENPEHECSGWGFDELYFEPIVSTMSICLEQWNISEVRLQFRALVGDMDHFRDKYSFFPDPGAEGFGGYCTMAPRRAVSWPASFQHRIDSFELANPSQNGRLTLLSLYLVDPSVRIRSTATVPPQIREWKAIATEECLPSEFPAEIRDCISSYVDGLSRKASLKRLKQRREFFRYNIYEERRDNPFD